MEEETPTETVDNIFSEWAEMLAHDPRVIEVADRPDFADLIVEIVQQALQERGARLLDELLRRAPQMLSEHLEDRAAFEASIRDRWGDALDLFEVFHVICLEAGESFNARHRPTAAATNDCVFDALTRIHARACLVAGEVLTLLRAGYPSGAHTRWRTIHELAVVAFFIREHGSETARRYLLHDGIQTHKAALSYREHHARLGYEPMPDEEFEGIQRRRDALVAEFNPQFADQYGWAADALGRPAYSFRPIEEAVSLDHMRAHYKMASHPVHPNVRGSFFDLGLAPGRDVLLAGPSMFGFVDPGYAACLSLYQTTVCLLNDKADLDGSLVMVALQELLPRVGEAFLEADTRQEERDATVSEALE
jgi:hypothetical protein